METEKLAKALAGNGRAEAGARALIKRAMRRSGLDIEPDTSPDLLASWARQPSSAPEIARGLMGQFERAADKWVEGNNSGDARRLEACNDECDNLRDQAEIVCAVLGLRVDYPGLYPTFMREHGTYYFSLNDIIRAIRGE